MEYAFLKMWSFSFDLNSSDDSGLLRILMKTRSDSLYMELVGGFLTSIVVLVKF